MKAIAMVLIAALAACGGVDESSMTSTDTGGAVASTGSTGGSSQGTTSTGASSTTSGGGTTGGTITDGGPQCGEYEGACPADGCCAGLGCYPNPTTDGATQACLPGPGDPCNTQSESSCGGMPDGGAVFEHCSADTVDGQVEGECCFLVSDDEGRCGCGVEHGQGLPGSRCVR